MKRSLTLMRLCGVAMIAALLVGACAPAATPTLAPTQPPPTSAPATQPSAATEAPTAAAPTVAPTEAATTAPAATDTAAAPAKPKSVTIALSQEPDLVSAHFSSMSYAVWIAQLVTVDLGKWDDNNNFVAELGAEVPSKDNGGVSADGLTITWKLKPGLKWSDGQPLTSADVKFTWQAVVDKGNAPYSRTGYDQIASIDTPDDTTVVVHFSKLYPDWQVVFGQGPNNNAGILPMHILQGKTGLEKDPFIHLPTVSSGVWVIKDWVAGDHMTLEPNPNYWGGKPKLDQLNLKFVPDPETALAALKTGDVDMVPDFAESDIATISALEPGIHLRVDSGPEFEHMLFNLGTTAGAKDASGKVIGQSDVNGPCALQDVNVRKAMMLGIDRQTIVDTLLEGKTTVPASLWPNSFWTNANLKPYPYDVDQANSLLDAAGYKLGSDGIRAGQCGGKAEKLSFTFETTDKQLRKDIGSALQDMLKKIGVEMKPTYTPAGTFFGDYSAGANMATGKYDLALYTTGFYPAPYTDNFLCAAIPNKETKGGSNNYHLCDPKLDAMFDQANGSADPNVRKPVFDQIQQYQYDNVLFVPIYVRANVYGYQDRLVFPHTSVISGWSWNTLDWDVK